MKIMFDIQYAPEVSRETRLTEIPKHVFDIGAVEDAT